MARSITTIFNAIIAAKEANSALDGLDTTSVTSVYRQWAWITATVHYVIETMLDLFRVEMQVMLASLKPGSLLWYQATCKAFQLGDDLTWINGQWAYAVIDTTKQIIAQCSVSEGERGLIIKVAKQAGAELSPLSAGELASFTAYVAKMKFAGTKVVIVNSAANLLNIDLTVYYSPLLLSQTGELISDGSYPINDAIQAYLAALPFNGRLMLTALVDAIQKASGVEDLRITVCQQKYGANPYADIVVSHIPESGYFKIDPANPLNISYQPHV